MRTSRVVLSLMLLGIAARSARAECAAGDDLEKVLGVSSDGRFLYSHETHTAAVERGEASYEIALINAAGESETTITRAANGAWQQEGKALPPSVLAGKPSQRVLETRLQTLLGGVTPLVPTRRDVRVVKGETVYRVFLDRALVKMLKAPRPASDGTSDRTWIARTYRHPSTALVFVVLSNQTQPRPSCSAQNVESIDWFTPESLDPNDKSVASTFCDEQLERDERRAPASDDEAYRPDEPLAQWVACAKDVYGASYLEQTSLRAATLDEGRRQRLLRAIAHTVETSWTPLTRMAKSKQENERAFALEALTSLGVELRTNGLHGDKRDPAFRAALLLDLKKLCNANPNASGREAAAAAACASEFAQPFAETIPDEEPCHPGTCTRQLVGVAPDGRFVIEQVRSGKLTFELRAPDGHLVLRLSDNCKSKNCSMRWDLEGAVSGPVLELTTADPKPEKLRAGLVKTLQLTPAAPSSQAIRLQAQLLRIGLWAIATLEQEKLGTMTALEHGASGLVFVDTADETCTDARCHLVVWGPRPVADSNDFAALASQCQKQTEVAALAACFGSIVDERVYPFLIQLARSDDDWRFGQAAARVATALGRKPLFEYAGASDAFKRQWALHALKQLLEDTTERLPFSGRAPDKRRPALLAEIEPYCKRGLADRDLVVAGAAIACLSQTAAKLDPARLREVLHSPQLDARAAVFEVAKRENVLVGAELRYVAGWLADPIDKKDPDYQEWLHGEICTLFVTKLDAANKAWLRPLVDARVKTMTLRPDSKGACKALRDLL